MNPAPGPPQAPERDRGEIEDLVDCEDGREKPGASRARRGSDATAGQRPAAPAPRIVYQYRHFSLINRLFSLPDIAHPRPKLREH